MTTHHRLRPDHNNPYRPPVDPLRPDHLRCGCGATADWEGRCRKCHARAAWCRHNTGRRAHLHRPRSWNRESRPARREAVAELVAGSRP